MIVSPAGSKAIATFVSRLFFPGPRRTRYNFWKFLIIIGAVFVLTVPDLYARKVQREKKIPTVERHRTTGIQNDLPLKHLGFNRAAAHDTTVLAQFDFDGGVSADAQGWPSFDRT